VRRFPALRAFPRVDLGVRPTPVEERRIAGLRLLVKRDDLTSGLYGGNKPRSLELLLARPARRLLTFSTLEAHHAYATAIHGRRLGLETDAILVRRGTAGELARRLRRIAARVVEVGGGAGAAAAALALWRPGTLVVPPGGMSTRGAVGYAAAALELDEVPRRIYAPLGSGTTVSGLLAGLMLRGARTEVVAVRVASRVAAWPRLLWMRAARAIALLRRCDPSVPRADPGGVTLAVVPADAEYGAPSGAASSAVQEAAAAGLTLEPTYTGAALAAALRDATEGAMLWNTYCPVQATPDGSTAPPG